MPRHFLFLLLLLPLTATARDGLRHPLRYIPGDSVVTWAADITDFRSAALGTDATLTSHTITTRKASRRTLRRAIAEWENAMLCQDITGGGSRNDIDAQCTAAIETVDRSARLMLLTGQSRYIDAMERPLFNLLPAVVSERESAPSFHRHAAAQTLFDAAGTVYATDNRRTVYVNFFLNSTTHIVTADLDMVIDQLTAMPHDGQVKIRLSSFTRGENLRLCIRIPDWAQGKTSVAQNFCFVAPRKQSVEILVNGRESLELTYENGYAVIDRQWNPGDEVLFTLPMHVQHLRHTADGNPVRGETALQRGPLLYATKADTTGTYYVTGTPPTEDDLPGTAGHIRLKGCLYIAKGTPADAPAPPCDATWEPYIDNRGTLWLKECK